MLIELIVDMDKREIFAYNQKAHQIDIEETKGKRIVDINYNEVGELVIILID